MSNTNYDVEKQLSYNNSYRHYIPTYHIKAPYYWYTGLWYKHQVALSFDDGPESNIEWQDATDDNTWNDENPFDTSVPDSGAYSKVYFRNPQRGKVTFTPSNCVIGILYNTKASFEVQFNSIGFAANQNASFKCSTIQKPTYKQYEWTAATVYYKKTTETSYQSVSGTVSGSWSDVRIDTNISLEDGYTYDIYIRATADDNTKASTAVGQFTTTDASSVSTCISPVGAFTNGEVTFVWAHATEYGTPQYAYDLQYSSNNGSSWTTVESHNVTQNTTRTITLTDAGVYKWRVRTYNSNDVAGDWAEATFVNNGEATPASSFLLNTKGRPTATWASTSQSAYQLQMLLNDSVVYDSGAVYSPQTSHFINQYFNDERSYVARVRIYNALGDVSDWVETGYQQEPVDDIVFSVTPAEGGGAYIAVELDNQFSKYYLLRNGKPIAEIKNGEYTDRFAVGITSYSVVAVTSDDQSDIQEIGFRVSYPQATVITLDGDGLTINKRVDDIYEIQTNNDADINKALFIGDGLPTHYSSNMRLKSFTVHCFDDQEFCENLLGQVVFYADNFGNGGYCIVTNYNKTDNFVKNGQGIYANEVALTLEVTNYDDSIKYPL